MQTNSSLGLNSVKRDPSSDVIPNDNTITTAERLLSRGDRLYEQEQQGEHDDVFLKIVPSEIDSVQSNRYTVDMMVFSGY